MKRFNLEPARDALFLDIDGTLIDIAPTPEEVVIPEGLVRHLHRLHDRLGGALALISGRRLADIDPMLDANDLPAAGAHGAEFRLKGGEKPQPPAPLPETLTRDIVRSFAGHPGVTVEDKSCAVAVHYRRTPAMEQTVKERIREITEGLAEPFKILHGKMVVEITRPGDNKGGALERFMQHPPFAGRRPVFLGDDETDLAAIDACLRLGGAAARVGGYEGTPAALSSPEHVRKWLLAQLA